MPPSNPHSNSAPTQNQPARLKMTRHDEIMLIKEIKALILDQVQAIYGPNHPTSTFAVITSRFDSGGRIREIEYTAQAIVYTREKSLAEWKLLVEGETGSTTVQAVEGLYRKLQGMLDKVTSEMGEGMVWNGVRAKHTEP